MRAKTSKKSIIEQNFEEVWLNGYFNTSIKDIVEKAGILKGSFYNYFPNKDQFIIEVLQTYSDMWLFIVSKDLADQSISPKARFARFFAGMREFYQQYDHTRGCMAANLSQEMGDVHDAISAEVNTAYTRIEGLYQQALEEAKVAGEIPDDSDTHMLACFLLNALQGALVRMKSCKSVQPIVALEHIVFSQIFIR